MTAHLPPPSPPADTSPNAWPEAMPLRREMPPPDPYPGYALPPVLRGMYDAMGDIIQSPDALRGQSVLAAAAIILQAHADVEMDGRICPISMFFLTMAASGERKSATDRAALSTHEEWQRQMRAAAPQAMREYELVKAKWQCQYDELAARSSNSSEAIRAALAKLGPEPPRPLVPLVKVAEPTFEGLVRCVAIDYPATSIVTDEAGAFLGGYAMARDHALRTAAGLAEFWDGKPISRPRGSEPNQLYYGRRVSMSLMAQPGVAASTLLASRLLVEQGLIARMLISYPSSNIGTRQYREQSLKDIPAAIAYWARMQELLAMPLPMSPDEPGALRPRVVSLEPTAKSEMIRFSNHIERLQKPGADLFRIRAHASKSAEHALRLASNIGLVSDPETGMLSRADIEAGIELAQFYINEHLRVMESANDHPDLVLAEQCLEWIRGFSPSLLFSTPDVYQLGPAAVRSKADANRILNVLVEHGYVRPVSGARVVNGTRRRDVWEARSDVISKIPSSAAC